jgi:hypothetical protein
MPVIRCREWRRYQMWITDGGDTLHLPETRVQAIQLSPYHAGPSTHRFHI